MPEPDGFDAGCREPGIAWIAAHNPLPDRPRDFWSPFRDDLRTAFNGRCGYYAMRLDQGTVDHFISWNGCKANQPQLAYEWSNFRYVAGSLNSKKGTWDDALLDPFEIEAGWFEVRLPSLLLVPTSRLPARLEAKTRHTLDTLDLQQGRTALRMRWSWYNEYRLGYVTLPGLQAYAPLLADAVQRWQGTNSHLPDIPEPR